MSDEQEAGGAARVSDATVTAAPAGTQKHPVLPHTIRILAVPIVLVWVAFTVLVNVIAPQLEVVGELHSAPMTPDDAPSVIAMKRMGDNFKEFNSNATVMVIIEGDKPSGRTRTITTTRSSTSWSRTPPTSSTSRISGATP